MLYASILGTMKNKHVWKNLFPDDIAKLQTFQTYVCCKCGKFYSGFPLKIGEIDESQQECKGFDPKK
jgi:hypothetical protein